MKECILTLVPIYPNPSSFHVLFIPSFPAKEFVWGLEFQGYEVGN